MIRRHIGMDDDFWLPRKCLREPISEIFHAAHLLDRAVSAHLAGHTAEAGELLSKANMPKIREWTESLWGSAKDNPDQHLYRRYRVRDDAPPNLPKGDRIPVRMPNTSERRQIIETYGRHCIFCDIPLISVEVRKTLVEFYPQAIPWGSTNPTQHAALQCMWMQFDHLLPHSRGGDNSIENVVVTCAPCNYGRGDNTLGELGLTDPTTRPHYKTSWDGLERLLVG